MEGQLIAAIGGLWLTLGAFVGGALRYLLSENKELKQQLAIQNKSTQSANQVNSDLAALVPGLLKERDDLRRQLGNKGVE